MLLAGFLLHFSQCLSSHRRRARGVVSDRRIRPVLHLHSSCRGVLCLAQLLAGRLLQLLAGLVEVGDAAAVLWLRALDLDQVRVSARHGRAALGVLLLRRTHHVADSVH